MGTSIIYYIYFKSRMVNNDFIRLNYSILICWYFCNLIRILLCRRMHDSDFTIIFVYVDVLFRTDS